jgi:hypothetical protein
MPMELRILQPSDKQALIEFGQMQLAQTHSDPMEREMQSWNARWRAEALDHYLPLGWSFAAYASELQGFLLAQPLLFYRGLTQTLWVETVQAATPEIAQQLLEAVRAWARDKHFQCVLNNDGAQEIKTARY